MTRKANCLVAAIAALFIIAASAPAKSGAFQVKDKNGTTTTVELVRVDTALYVPMRALVAVLTKADRRYTIEFDNKTGSLRITKGDLKATLFLGDEKILAGDSLIQCDAPLRVYQGEVLIPYGSFEVVNKYFAEFELINPPEEIKRLEEVIPAETLSPHEPGATPAPAQAGLAVEETVSDLGFVEIPQETRIEAPERLKSEKHDLREALAKEAVRPSGTTVVLDPGGSDLSAEQAGREIPLKVARRVEELLEASGNLTVSLTQDDASRLSPEERVRKINTSGADLLVAVRVDASEFTNLRGIQIYCAHEAADWQGRQYKGDATTDYALPPELAYLRYQYHSLVLAGFVKRELKRSVPEQIWQVNLAPLYVLKRANMPSVLIVLGYASNKEDMSLLEDASYRESVSRAIAGAILSYQRYFELAEKQAEGH
jgi:N-acetylmuramoyl-L-alanine amidase